MIFVISILESTNTTSFNSFKEIFCLIIPDEDPRDKNRESHFAGNKAEKSGQGSFLILI
jgi:hypothetical protein